KLPCRLPEQVATKAEVVVEKKSRPFNSAAGTQEIVTLVLRHFAARADVLRNLLDEASLVEQATNDLAERTLPANKQFTTAMQWEEWLVQIARDLQWDGENGPFPSHEIHFRTSGGAEIRPFRLVELWARQPWSPLFLDWQITWVPTTPQLVPRNAQPGKDVGPTWPLGDVDYKPLDRKSLEPFIAATGITVRGRSLVSPIDDHVFDKPLETL